MVLVPVFEIGIVMTCDICSAIAIAICEQALTQDGCTRLRYSSVNFAINSVRIDSF